MEQQLPERNHVRIVLYESDSRGDVQVKPLPDLAQQETLGHQAPKPVLAVRVAARASPSTMIHMPESTISTGSHPQDRAAARCDRSDREVHVPTCHASSAICNVAYILAVMSGTVSTRRATVSSLPCRN